MDNTITVTLLICDESSSITGRTYPKAEIEKAAKEYMERPMRLGVVGDCVTDTEINIENISHRIINMWVEGNELKAELTILSETPSGKMMLDLMERNIHPRFAPIGTGMNENGIISDYNILYTAAYQDGPILDEDKS